MYLKFPTLMIKISSKSHKKLLQKNLLKYVVLYTNFQFICKFEKKERRLSTCYTYNKSHDLPGCSCKGSVVFS